ncbi:RNA pyrophosphohydrolase [Pseudobacteriovorax antillogorgiicola]|uniref:Putative (Di)nucleoside polyphosphate hydrolase n=1 Tax=Pseudobacteriovorax antillogorgiicola TaxID=1513793 RepID=A0A1Y6CTE5_9BACT|nr:RNA pyrophosphohydrolase [Pseudobacteriovorax antillogorgiicola]TCS45653.1 putative (di)nucleoside polyphosphate hydrolase [Pseudobacteriovorax antillogorgiicola]SMF72920.1 putative (di)nucleoside polyphosphate hydrolase [Pseudobacteriovorax antillogorgiicola]
MRNYRDCVVAVIVGENGLVFAGERDDRAGVWQLPQGGIDPGESPKEALLRELREEIGTDRVRVVREGQDWIHYDFPEDLEAPIAKKFRGQRQKWFLLEFLQDAEPSIEKSDKEFASLSWKNPAELMRDIVAWKKEAYEKGFEIFSLIKE